MAFSLGAFRQSASRFQVVDFLSLQMARSIFFVAEREIGVFLDVSTDVSLIHLGFGLVLRPVWVRAVVRRGRGEHHQRIRSPREVKPENIVDHVSQVVDVSALVEEDEVASRSSFRLRLVLAGYEVQCADCGLAFPAWILEVVVFSRLFRLKRLASAGSMSRRSRRLGSAMSAVWTPVGEPISPPDSAVSGTVRRT